MKVITVLTKSRIARERLRNFLELESNKNLLEELITTERAAKILGLRPNSLMSAISREQISLKKYKMKGATLFSKKDVLFWKNLNKIAKRLGK